MNKKFLIMNILSFLILPLKGMAESYATNKFSLLECWKSCQMKRAECGKQAELPEDIPKCQLKMGECEASSPPINILNAIKRHKR